ncbi:MAG: hypothetical protein ABIW76_21420 [Fibrobacteria bacterium]
MSQISQAANATNPIQAVAFEFEVCARRAIECLLNLPTLSFKGFGTHTLFPVEPEVRCTIECANRAHSMVISLGLSSNDLKHLLSGKRNAHLALDAILEVLNITAGRLFVCPAFTSRFGYMCPSVPSLYSPRLDMAQAEVLRGVLLAGAAHLFMELRASRIIGER